MVAVEACGAAAGLAISAGEAEQYAREGYFVREAAFSEGELAGLREAAERVVERAAGGTAAGRGYEIDGNRYVDNAVETVQYEHRTGSATIRVIEPFHHLHPRFEALLDDPRIVAPMRGILGTDRVALWTDKINLKRPREGSRFRWHQDSPYWTHASDDVDRLPNVMLALDDASEHNGCFRVVPGSHRQGCLPGIRDDTRIGVLFTDPSAFDESRQVLLEVPAGSLVFFSPHIVHGSQPNASDAPRRAMVLTYQPGDRPMFKRPGTRNAGVAASR